MSKVIIFNPRSANGKHRIPNSILQVGASIHGKYEYVFVDGNLEADPWEKINAYLSTNEFSYFGLTVMPGPQLKQAIPYSKQAKELYPNLKVIWGGYFASNQYKVTLESGYVDFIVNGPGDNTFPELISALEAGETEKMPEIKNLIYFDKERKIKKTPVEALLDQDQLPDLPYTHLDSFYPIEKYLSKTFLGKRTLAYHSSMGCPFTCSFCAVVPIYNAKWKGKSAEKIYQDIKYFKEKYDLDAIEFHDNNFFTSKKRVLEFSELVKDDNIEWWGEGRIDTINLYNDEELTKMHEAGCKMIFLGAETGNDEVLKQMNKGGTQSGQMIKDFALRLKNIGIIPEFSFVLGMPGDTEKQVYDQILWDINFIKEIKEINPDAEIIIYIYSPVPTEGSDLYQQIIDAGFSFPTVLEDWISPTWENFDLRKNPLTPWLTPKMIDTIRNFEVVLNGLYPTASDFRIKGLVKYVLKSLASWRYKSGVYGMPYEIKAIHKLWKYRQPEKEGFYSE
ncbi:B12-binding domain-containing radical SAM protein [Ekhidna sp. To15]|uniref:B12-binding domain-containing radical SAM protein n=1 Tax=Ekhidna sp. To15 TaxID=3395267 RepID=UPI003F528A16